MFSYSLLMQSRDPAGDARDEWLREQGWEHGAEVQEGFARSEARKVPAAEAEIEAASARLARAQADVERREAEIADTDPLWGWADGVPLRHSTRGRVEHRCPGRLPVWERIQALDRQISGARRELRAAKEALSLAKSELEQTRNHMVACREKADKCRRFARSDEPSPSMEWAYEEPRRYSF